MKRFVLLAVTVFACCLVCSAQDAKSVVAKYSSAENAEFISVDRKTFNLVKPFLPMDKQTKQIFKVLNLSQLDMMIVSNCTKEKGDAIMNDLNDLADDDVYQATADEKAGVLILAKAVDSVVTEFVMVQNDAAKGELTLIRVDCHADVEDISTLM